MTAPVLSPVRWWRDDATRYVTRGPQLVPGPAHRTDLAWAFELIRGPVDPGLQRLLDTYADFGSVPTAELLQGGPSGMSDTGVALNEYRARIGLPPLEANRP